MMQSALAYLGLCLMFGLCVGMTVRRKVSQCVAFFSYIAVGAAYGLLISLWPDANTPEAYMVKQGVYHSLFFGMALEIGYKAFRAFAGIASTVRALLAIAVTLSTLLLLILTPRNSTYTNLGSYQPAITTAAIWCLSFVALLVVWYQIPVPAFTRTLLLTFVPYLVVFVICMDLLARRGWAFVQSMNVINAAAYDLTAGYLAYAAWRKD